MADVRTTEKKKEHVFAKIAKENREEANIVLVRQQNKRHSSSLLYAMFFLRIHIALTKIFSLNIRFSLIALRIARSIPARLHRW